VNAKRLDPRVPVVLYADEWGGYGGTANYVVMLAHGLRRQGYRVAAICHRAPGVAAMRQALLDAGVDVRAIEGGTGAGLGDRLGRLRGFVSLFRERQYRGAILALMMGYFTRGGAVTLAASAAGAGGIVCADLTPPEPPITRAQVRSLRFKDRFTDRVVVGALENRAAFARQMGRDASRVDVVHTGIELQRFTPGDGRDAFRQELGIGSQEAVVGTMSRLDDTRKGVDLFLQMAAQLAPRWPAARFLVVGDGLLRPGLEAQAAALGLGQRVIFAGWRRDTARVLAGLDVFVMPSLFEGGPTTVLEAMAMGQPVVASRVGMVPEVIEEGRSGLIVPPGDVSALTLATTRLLEDPPLAARIGARAREQAVGAFSIDQMVGRYLEVFARAREGRARHPRRRLGL
jgi:glycosyltransferase involved in cell wall biosynthesis